MKNLKLSTLLIGCLAIFAMSFTSPEVHTAGLDKYVKSDTATQPRWGGSGANVDNTGRVLTYKYLTVTDATGADSVRLNPQSYQTIVKYTAVDSLAFVALAGNGRAAIGDQLTFLVTNSAGAGHKVKFVGAFWAVGSGGDITLTASKKATIKWVFDGFVWVEQSRTVQ